MKPYKTIEHCSHGATYRHRSGYTVYKISVYPRHSVLAGQQSRTFLDHYETLEAAQAAHPDAQLIPGSTYQEPDLRHLPDDGDYY